MSAITVRLNKFGPVSSSLTTDSVDKDIRKKRSNNTLEAENIYESDLKKIINALNNFNYEYNNSLSIGKIIDEEINSKNIILDIFPESRDFTEEEARLYKESINELFNDTGRKLYDI